MSIKNYEKIRILGSGSYGNVTLCRHRIANNLYAIKSIKKPAPDDENKELIEKQYETEKEVLSHTNHPNIIKLYYTFSDEEYYYLVLEYAPNGNLRILLNTKEKLSFYLAQYYAAELINGIEHLHKNGFIHCDLKPENILLDENFHLKITDFGSARIISKSPKTSKIITAGNLGNPGYSSPEICNGEISTYSSDLWSFGIIVYEFFTGTIPFLNSCIIQK